MRFIKRFIALAIVFPTAAALVRAEEPALPTPPQQTAPWTPPDTKLPRSLVEAAQTLFDQGLADPRGCEYRRVRVRVGDQLGRQSEVPTTGWVLPADGDDEPQFAVAWSGLVYPLVSVDKPADLDAQVRTLVAWSEPDAGMPINPERSDEAESIALAPPHPVQVCLLLRLGRADLAEALWASARQPRRGDVSYLSLATDLAWFRFNRAVRAHMEGDDALALADARALDAFWRAVDAKAEEMGLRPRPQTLPPGYKMASRYIIFLDQAPALLADQERRARERANPPPPAPEENKAAPLIRALDQIQGATTSPRRHLSALPAVQALTALGEDAVEPLIQDLRSEARLTRLYGYNRWLARERIIVPVDQVVFAALSEILKLPDFGPLKPVVVYGGEPTDRNALADRIQAYWVENGSIPPAER